MRANAAHRGSDCRLRSGDDGGSGTLQRRARRADHRHQHGLSGEEGVQRRRGSALLAYEPLVASIVEAVVRAVDVPVTLKNRTGSDPRAAMPSKSPVLPSKRDRRTHRSWPHARLRVRWRGRIRDDRCREARGGGACDSQRRHRYAGQSAGGPAHTGADAVMIGRAAQGRPWIFREIAHFLPPATPAAAAGRRGPRSDRPIIWTITMRSTARGRGRAHRAQAPRLVAPASLQGW